MQRLFMRIAILLVILAGAASSATAQGNFPPPLTADQKVKISFYNYNLASAGIGKDGTEQLIKEFMEKFPNIEVEGVGASSAEILARTQADVVAGNAPDVAQLVFSDLDFIATNLGAKPLEEIVSPEELAAHFVGFSERGKGLASLNGKTWGLPYVFSTPVLFYNADLFKAAGLDPDKPPTNWEEATAYAKAITEKTGNPGIIVAALGQFDWMFQSLVLSNGGRVLSEDRKTVMFAEPAGVEVVTMWQELVKSGTHPNVGFNEAFGAFGGGKMGMYLQTSAVQANLIKASTGVFELRAAAMPAFGDKPTKPTHSGSALFILSNDPLKQRAAWELMKFATSERGFTIITSKIGYLPLRPGIVDDPQYLKEWVEQNPLVRPNLEQLTRLEQWVSWPGPNYQQATGIMMKAVEEAITSTGDVEPILKAAQERAQELLPQ